jgi:hypothetical protein
MRRLGTVIAGCAILATTPACPSNWPFPEGTYLGMDCKSYVGMRRPVHVEIRFLDARQVALLSNDGSTLLPAGGGPAGAPVVEGVHSTGQFSSGKYTVRAARDADGSLGLNWTSEMPLPQGARQILVTTGGAVQDLPVEAEVLGLVGRDHFELTLCIEVHSARYGGIIPASRPATIYDPCQTNVKLSTPWSNVATIRQITAATPDYSVRPAPNVLSAQEACHLPPSQPQSEVTIFDHAFPTHP